MCTQGLTASEREELQHAKAEFVYRDNIEYIVNAGSALATYCRRELAGMEDTVAARVLLAHALALGLVAGGLTRRERRVLHRVAATALAAAVELAGDQ